MSTESFTPICKTQSKKRVLSSPEFDIDLKKNKVSLLRSPEFDNPPSESTTMASSMTTEESADINVSTEEPARLTLQEGHIQAIASHMKDSFQPQVSQIIQDIFQQQITSIVNSVVEGVLKGLNSKITSLQQANQELKTRIAKREASADNVEQYSRRNCLRITGIAESDNENTDDIVIQLARSIDVDLNLQDIDRSHRLGKPGSVGESSDSGATARSRAIIVKFATYRMRAKFYKSRVLTKSRGYRGVYINEHLTTKEQAVVSGST